jgi:methionyl aminopeptidase
MTIAIEPIATLGGGEIVLEGDGWTLVTRDGSWAAQTEHTILVAQGGGEVLTRI